MRRDAQATFLDTLQQPIIASRWMLIAAETLETAFLLERRYVDPLSVTVLLGLFSYNVAALLLASRVRLTQLPTKIITALDLCFLAAACWVTGGAQSPFVAQLFLIIIRAALFDGLAGGVASGASSAIIAVVLAHGSRVEAVKTLQDIVPNFLLAGIFSGYLVDRLRASYDQREQARLEAFESSTRAEAARREMELARTMQEALIPKDIVSCPGVQVSSRWEFAREVGGDFHFLMRDENRIGLVVGDVCGKGMPAAMAATTIAHLLPWLRPLQNPLNALRELNRDLCERMPDGSFATMALVEIAPDDGEIRIWNAGHPPPLIWRASDSKASTVEHYDILLGAFPQWTGQPAVLPLEPGDLLVLYSDGLIEVHDESRRLFDPEDLKAVLAANAQERPDEIAGALLNAARKWGQFSDDVTVIVFRYTGCQCDLNCGACASSPAVSKGHAYAHQLA